ncbi:MAG: hypothetical protein V4510_12700 [bacterium]
MSDYVAGDDVVGEWSFTVMHEAGEDCVRTYWMVYDPSTETEWAGDTKGALPYGILAAYDETGLTCPLIIDADLAKLSGLAPREEDA